MFIILLFATTDTLSKIMVLLFPALKLWLKKLISNSLQMTGLGFRLRSDSRALNNTWHEPQSNSPVATTHADLALFMNLNPYT